jgi:hypothetical protein
VFSTVPRRGVSRLLVVVLASLAVGLAESSHRSVAADPVAASVLEPVAAPDEPAGMRALFNGRDLAGWSGDPRLWSVRDGVIHGETTPENVAQGNTFLIFRGPDREQLLSSVFRDFELRLSFRCTAANNSGIQYRSEPIRDKARNAWVVTGYQHELRNEVGMPNVTGFIYDEAGKAGRLNNTGEKAVRSATGQKSVEARLIDQGGFERLFRIDDWNDVVIIAEGNHIRHFLNGRQVLDFVDHDPATFRSAGVIALQLHAGAPMWAEFKDIRLKELP